MTVNLTPAISVCVCTYKRPGLLLSLLESLSRQTFVLTDFEIVIVDNDDMESAKNTVQTFAQTHPEMTVRYAVETVQGISYARNRTVAMASADVLAFIDDDESAVEHWLTDMSNCLRNEQADAVMGPVLPEYPSGTPQWIVDSKFFERPRFRTGTHLNWGDTRTSNAIVRASWARKRQPNTFQEEFAHSGGEDTDFFKWVEDNGGKLTWCDSAIVTENVPVTRQTLSFILERSFRGSVTYWRQMFAQHSPAWRLKKAAIGLAGGCVLLMLGALKMPFGRGHAVRLLANGAKAWGRVGALSDIELVGYGKK